MSDVTDEQLAQIEADLQVPKPEPCGCSWKEPHIDFDCDYEDRRGDWIAANARVAAVAPLLVRALRDARAWAERWRLACDSEVDLLQEVQAALGPIVAEFDVLKRTMAVVAERDSLRERLAAAQRVVDSYAKSGYDDALIRKGQILDELAAALAAPTGQADESECGCGHGRERHGPEAGGCIECRCTAPTGQEEGRG